MLKRISSKPKDFESTLSTLIVALTLFIKVTFVKQIGIDESFIKGFVKLLPQFFDFYKGKLAEHELILISIVQSVGIFFQLASQLPN